MTLKPVKPLTSVSLWSWHAFPVPVGVFSGLLVCTFVDLVSPVDKEWCFSLIHLSLVLSSQVSAA